MGAVEANTGRTNANKAAADTSRVPKALTRITQAPYFLEPKPTSPSLAVVRLPGSVGTTMVVILQKLESEGLPAQYGRLFEQSDASDGWLHQFSVNFVTQRLQGCDEVLGRAPQGGEKLQELLEQLGAWPTKEQDIVDLAKQLEPAVKKCVSLGKPYYQGARLALVGALDALAEKHLRAIDMDAT